MLRCGVGSPSCVTPGDSTGGQRITSVSSYRCIALSLTATEYRYTSDSSLQSSLSESSEREAHVKRMCCSESPYRRRSLLCWIRWWRRIVDNKKDACTHTDRRTHAHDDTRLRHTRETRQEQVSRRAKCRLAMPGGGTAHVCDWCRVWLALCSHWQSA